MQHILPNTAALNAVLDTHVKKDKKYTKSIFIIQAVPFAEEPSHLLIRKSILGHGNAVG